MSETPAPIASGNIAAVRAGRAALLTSGRPGLRTAYVKAPVAGPVEVHALGLHGDEQVNRRDHGGPEKAVYGYPVSGYAGWRAEFPDLAERFVPGAMGENLVVAELDEATVAIGDVIRCGTALLQISQIREPCSTFTAVIGTAKAARAMVRSARCGWYYRVLEGGIIEAGMPHDVVDRPNPDWTVARFAAFAAGKAGTVEAIAQLVKLPGLTPEWRDRAAQQLARQRGVLELR